MQIEENLIECLTKHQNINGDCIQIFTKSPMKFTDINTKIKTEGVKQYLTEHNIKLYIHSQYIINLCNETDWGIKSLVDDMEFGEKIGASGVVVHMGKNCKKYNMNNEEGYKKMKMFINKVLSKCSGCKNVKFLLENSAGQGTELGGDPEDLLNFNELNVNYCIDTAHLWGNGYDIKQYFNKFEEIIGLDKLELIHLNDSLVKKGSKKDRHAPLNSGQMEIRNDIEFLLDLNKPIVLETGGDYGDEIKYLKEFKNNQT
jgi:deoxyribonuclease-4